MHQSFFDEMLHRAPTLGPVLVSMMTDRVRETTRLAQQREKMMALGKLSAGLAHELNNPATAVRRDADALDEQLARLPELTRMLLVHGIDAEALARAGAWLAASAKGTTSAASEAARWRARAEPSRAGDRRLAGRTWRQRKLDAGGAAGRRRAQPRPARPS